MNKVVIVLCSVFLVNFSFAQNNRGSSLNKDLTITKERNIELPEVNRNYEKVTYDVPQSEVTPQQYDYVEVPGEMAKLDMKIRVRTLNPDELSKIYGNYIKAGFGNYVTPYLEGHFNSKRNDKYSYGIHLRHLSSSRGPVEYARTGVNNLGVYGRYFLNKVTIDGDLSWQRQRFNYYGFDHSVAPEIDEDTIKLVYNLIRAGLKFTNADSDAQVNYKVGLNYFNLGNNADSRENEFLIDYAGGYRMDNEKNVRISGEYSFSSRKYNENFSRHFFQIRPSLVLSRENYRITAGATVAYTTDTTFNSGLHLYPILRGDYFLIPDQLMIFAGLGGEMQRNTWRTFMSQNPWLLNGVALSNTNKTLDLYAGLQGNTLERLTYKARLAYETYRYLPFFVNAASDTSAFDIIYDSGQASILNFYAAFAYEFTQKFRLGLDANLYSYGLSNMIAAPWHRPSFDMAVLGSYNLHKKIYFNVDIFYISGLKGRNPVSGEAEKLKDIFDLNLKLEYRFSNPFSAFVQLNNILGKNYQRYMYYPVKGTNVIVGVSYTF